ncbi:MAG: hypothetical protein PHP54_05890 [Clostridia bacterium]|nr:hypothetical protein [Clostridia bacterium]
MMKTVKITHKEFAIEAIINNSDEIEVREGENGRFYITVVAKKIKKSNAVPILPGFKRVYEISLENGKKYICKTNECIIQNESDGSYFTWCPISDTIIENGFGRLNLDNAVFNDENFHEEVTPELEAIHDFIRLYGGIYMVTFTASKGSDGIAKFVPNANPWVNICYENSSDDTDAVRESKKYADTLKEGAKFCIEYGELWDYICQSLIDRELATFDEVVKDSKRLGTYCNNDGEKLLETGTKLEYMIGGLYGLAGCVWRWTQESWGTKQKVCRGGSLNNPSFKTPLFYRYDICTTSSGHSIGFGGVLYGSTDICYPTQMIDMAK